MAHLTIKTNVNYSFNEFLLKIQVRCWHFIDDVRLRASQFIHSLALQILLTELNFSMTELLFFIDYDFEIGFALHFQTATSAKEKPQGSFKQMVQS